eukprot:SAG31_NODE_1156_length_9616_cov_26.963014_1_plen_71_part_10
MAAPPLRFIVPGFEKFAKPPAQKSPADATESASESEEDADATAQLQQGQKKHSKKKKIQPLTTEEMEDYQN